MRLLRTLTGKLIAVFLVLMVAAAAFYLGLTLITTKAHLELVSQSLNTDVAAHLIENHLKGDRFEPDEGLVNAVFLPITRVNPSAEIYLLDAGGRIIATGVPKAAIQRPAVSIEPIRAFIDKTRSLPIYGDDPRHLDLRKVFSAAAVQHGDAAEQYVYVVLGGEDYSTTMDLFRESYILRLILGLLFGGIASGVALGALMFYRLTSPLRQLAQTVAAFDPKHPADAGIASSAASANDEVGQLSRSFADMAARIALQVRQLKEADQIRSEFMVHISHDLKAPIASIRGYLETLQIKGSEMPAAQRDSFLASALLANERILKMVDDIFELAKLDQPEVRLCCESFSLPELVQDVCQKLQHEAERAGVRFRYDWGADNLYVTGDIALIERALVNLIGNAIKYSDSGSVVETRVGQRGHATCVSIMNGGEPIGPSEIANIFLPFYRGRQAERKAVGSGLGLTIAKRIADLHGGSLAATSDAVAGTRFTLTLSA